MSKLSVLSLIIVLSALRASAADDPAVNQEQSGAQIAVTTIGSTGQPTATTLPVGTVVGPIRCDSDGNIYIRTFDGKGSALQNPLVRISSNGKEVRRFDPKRVPGLSEHFTSLLYTVGGVGKVYQIVSDWENQTVFHEYLVTFTKDGEYVGRAEFETHFEPYVFLALPSGGFLLSGIPSEGKTGGESQRKTLTAVFDSDARIVRDLTSDSDNGPESSTATTNPTIQNGDARVGTDGSVYLLKASTPPRVQVISERGELLRELKLEPPMPGAQALELHSAGDRLFVRFQSEPKLDPVTKTRKRSVVFAAYDPQSGQRTVAFQSSVKGMTACIQSDRVTFLVPGNDGNFAVLSGDLPK
ncbi:MAG TPA: hypothetical protein VFA60_09425 [Terriglobales bacterium]|nr:hypothetical protein [Terriglobales bacterium]